MAQPTYASGDDLATWLAEADPVADADELGLAVEAASRAVDRACNRSFGLAPAPEARHYTAEYDRHLGLWLVDIDDVQTTTGLVVELDNDRDGAAETTVTAYQLAPVNSTDRPYIRIEFLPGAPVKPNGVRHGVKVTARWGWTEVPDSIVLATLTQASRFYARRENPSGPLQSKKVDDVSYGWHATDLDSDVATLVAPYRRVWGAV
jgi:hypothetical protein